MSQHNTLSTVTEPISVQQPQQPVQIMPSPQLGGNQYGAQPVMNVYSENMPVLCQFCNQMITPVFQSMTAPTEKGNKTGVFAMLCCGPCGFCIPYEVETKVVRLCPNCKVPV